MTPSQYDFDLFSPKNTVPTRRMVSDEIDTNHRGNEDLDQYFTPEWAAEAIVETFYRDLTAKDFVVEPSCGPGAFLKAVPEHIPMIGIELDPVLAERAAKGTSRQVFCGDFRTINLPAQPTVLIGNPPFSSELFQEFLDRAKTVLPQNGRCGFILPSYFIQTSASVMRWNKDWSLEQTALPRDLFHNLSKPLIFCQFRKDELHTMVGFALYREQTLIRDFSKAARIVLIKGKDGVNSWRGMVEDTLRNLGGKATLEQLYRAISPKAPLTNSYPEAKIRQTLQRGEGKAFRRVDSGRWELVALAA